MRNQYKVLLEKYQVVKETGINDKWSNNQTTITLSQVLEYLKDTPAVEMSTQQLKPFIVSSVSNPSKEDKTRIDKSDLQYPIIVVTNNGTPSYILDGNHRLAKAVNAGIPTIKVKKLELTKAPSSYQQLFK